MIQIKVHHDHEYYSQLLAMYYGTDSRLQAMLITGQMPGSRLQARLIMGQIPGSRLDLLWDRLQGPG
jgi:hypothetical protein